MSPSHHPDGPSRLGRRFLCPASYHLERKAAELGVSEDTEDAAEGTLLHSKLPPDQPLDDLDAEQRSVVEKARAYIQDKLPRGCHYEMEGALTLQMGKPPIIRGTLDVLGSNSPYDELYWAIVIDVKFGRAELHQEMIELQMRPYAAMAMQLQQSPRAKVFVFQPRTGVEYTGEYSGWLPIAQGIKDRLDYCESNPQEHVPSPAACQFCLGKSLCPAFRGELSVIEKPTNGKVALPMVFKFLDWKPAINRALEWATEEAKKLPAEVLEAHGYRRREVPMPKMNQYRSGKTYTQVRIERAGK